MSQWMRLMSVPVNCHFAPAKHSVACITPSRRSPSTLSKDDMCTKLLGCLHQTQQVCLPKLVALVFTHQRMRWQLTNLTTSHWQTPLHAAASCLLEWHKCVFGQRDPSGASQQLGRFCLFPVTPQHVCLWPKSRPRGSDDSQGMQPFTCQNDHQRLSCDG